MNTHQIIETLLSGKDLPAPIMRDFVTQMMSGSASPVSAAATLIALRSKGEAIAELVAAAEVMRDFSNKVHMSADMHLLDIVGTGGDGTSTFNISTTCLFVIAAAGGRVAKHGNRSVSSKSGSADAIEALGGNLNLTSEQVAQCIEQTGIGFMFAPNHHPAMRHISPIRRELGVRTLFNMIGPLSNPANAPYTLMGVYSRELLPVMANAMKQLGAKRVLVVHSDDGMDEVSVFSPTHVCELNNGEIREYTLTPETFGLQHDNLDAIRVNNPEESIQMLKNALGNHAGAARDMVLMNAGVALYTLGVVNDIAAGIEKAREVIASGAALRKMNEYVECTQQFKTEDSPA